MSATPAPQRIVLIGFMGAGKSTTGRLLASALGWRFVDSDDLIEARVGHTIAEIFTTQGEDAFRALESEVIRQQCCEQHLVLALGGGAIEHPSTREHLHTLPDTHIVYLEAPLDVMVARCLEQPGAAIRPVLADRVRLAHRFTSRIPHYRTAHLTVATAHLTPEQVVERILAALGGTPFEPAPSAAGENLPTR
ncbi:shikimate kinase [Silvibacterium dinghuense]|nr:shikimate kinase [Silvibacterium dinghuense]GGH12554.1 shikimate kinase [Silvibacterium dinghuense]